MNLILDMETADPDDALSLAWLASHPQVKLRAVTVMPGTRTQIGLVRAILARCGASGVPVGSRSPERGEESLSGRFYDGWLGGQFSPETADGHGHAILAQALSEFPDATLMTGAPLHNLRLLLVNHPAVEIRRWVGQGGFAGDSLVTPENRLAKFAGKEVCPTWNLDGDQEGARLALQTPRLHLRQLVSKNVCHGVVYDETGRDRMRNVNSANPGYALFRAGLDVIEATKGLGTKALHDLVAAAVLIRPDVVEMREVEIYRDRGGWGSRPLPGSRTWISVAVSKERFWQTLELA